MGVPDGSSDSCQRGRGGVGSNTVSARTGHQLMPPLRISRRSFVHRFCCGFALAGLAAACGPLRPIISGGTQPPPTQGTAAPAQVNQGGEFILGTITPVPSSNPYPRNPGTTPFYWGLFNTLIRLDANRQPIPELAESWSFSEDRLTLTFKLRSDVKFHSGRAFTAEDARWNIDHALDPKSAVTVGGELQGTQATARDAL